MPKKTEEKIDNKVQEALSKLEVDMVGVVRIDELKKNKLTHAAQKLLPSVKSIVVMGMEIYPEFLDLTSPEMMMGTPNMTAVTKRRE